MKVLVTSGVNWEIAGRLLSAVVDYAEFVERSIGNDPNLTAPWLFGELDEAGAVLRPPEGA
jgi:hypothetical protein